VDYGLTDKGVHVSDDFISTIFDGTMHEANISSGDIVRHFSQMPYYDPTARDMQIFVSEYSISTILKTVVDSDYVHFTEALNDDNIDGIIPDFDMVFGDHKDNKVIIKTSPSSVFMPIV
jgi:hypothetical protein